jgi:hypothetical protein
MIIMCSAAYTYRIFPGRFDKEGFSGSLSESYEKIRVSPQASEAFERFVRILPLFRKNPGC